CRGRLRRTSARLRRCIGDLPVRFQLAHLRQFDFRLSGASLRWRRNNLAKNTARGIRKGARLCRAPLARLSELFSGPARRADITIALLPDPHRRGAGEDTEGGGKAT